MAPDLSHRITRAPHWRWLRAAELALVDRPGPEIQDPRMRLLVRYHRRLRDVLWIRHAIDTPLLIAMHTAATIFTDKAAARWLLEALIFGDAATDRIAALTGIEPSIIAAFENSFYDTRELLRIPLWPSLHLTDLAEQVRPSHPRLLWKRIAMGGAEQLIRVLTGAATAADAQQLLKGLAHELRADACNEPARADESLRHIATGTAIAEVPLKLRQSDPSPDMAAAAS